MTIMIDDETSIRELKEKVRKFCDERDWDQFHGAKELAIALVIESAELLEHFRYKSDKEIDAVLNSPEKKEKVCEEMADIFGMLLRLAQRYDIDLATELDKKLAKNEKKYPVEKAKGCNKKYTEY
jgi:NTP pyrophosphatase (non-canonical NTP hydrolase)